MNDDPKNAILAAIEKERAEQAPHMTWWEIDDARSFLRKLATRIGATSGEDAKALVEAWLDLHRTGVLSYGTRLLATERSTNIGPWQDLQDMRATPFGTVYTTAHGGRVLEHVRRDPSNPAGYLAHVDPDVPGGSVARSYLDEALRTYGMGCDRATAVLIGCATEAMVLELRTELVAKYTAVSKTPPTKIAPATWQVRTIIDGIKDLLAPLKSAMGKDLYESFDFRWTTVLDIIRRARNDVGHPTNLSPVTHDDVHALLLFFPEAARLTRALTTWAQTAFAP